MGGDAARVDPAGPQRGHDQLVAGDRLGAAGDVEQALAPLHREAGQERREVGRERRDAHLVGEHAVELAAVEGTERPAHEVGAPPPEHPRRAHRRPRRGVRARPRARRPASTARTPRSGAPRPTRRRAAWRRRRTRSRSRRGPGGRPGGRSPAPAARTPSAFTAKARSGSRSQRVDVGHRRGVDDRVGRELGHHLLDLLTVGEVERVARGGRARRGPRGPRRPGPRPARLLRSRGCARLGSVRGDSASRPGTGSGTGVRWRPAPGSWSWAAARW